ncbi:cytidine/deoxycytidylate deaminase family protein [Candidatus Oleimmundimicrobium sp.]|uniref:deoxycytidylate deaminase n=1 Tax=Candidatus Oleimmundimicrobium sp. TaxID=3060597 RepID=UPI002716ED9E|nr:cytidine/deoxycytidylate deaminase family protein [Candidatus Oleimmundimicrobium sp.]MDO8885465.1 cytidine/deoxycytidylate deaminase family protein [Candidatus Oleimmundimicrobium sp.]
MNRPTWDEYFMKITEEVSTRSTCLRRQVGAVIVKDKRILATGYNGAPSGLKHCLEVGCIRELQNIPSGEKHELCRGLHAEQNAIIQAALHGIKIGEALIYTTHQPCILCAKMLINAGIKEIIYRDAYLDSLAEKMIKEAEIKIRQLRK